MKKLNMYQWHDQSLKRKSITTDFAALFLLIAGLILFKYVDAWLALTVIAVAAVAEIYSWKVQRKDKALKKAAKK